MKFSNCLPKARVGLAALLAASFAMTSSLSLATGVPIEGFLPLVGIALTNEFNDDFVTASQPSSAPGGILLGDGGTAHYDIALLDTGAGLSLLTAQADLDFDISGPYTDEPDGFRGTFTVPIGGATGTLVADINDPVGLYAGGLQSRTGSGSFAINHTGLRGQTNSSLITVPATSDLPNVVGLPFASQYATHINADQPQLFQHNGRTTRTPAIKFEPLGSGGGAITRRAPLTLNPGASFQQAPSWVFDFNNPDFINHPHENPMFPTLLQGALFLNADIANDGNQLNNSELFFDSGASVSVLSELKALQLGIDVQLDTPDFVIDIVGSGGLSQDLPGYFIESLTIQAIGGNVTATNVPVIVLDITDPGNPGNIVDGIIGTNLLVGRNLVIDPNPALGGGGNSPSLYISDPVTTQKQWASATATGSWHTAGNWSATGVPVVMDVANVRNTQGGARTAVVSSDATAWELNISSSGPTAHMRVEVATGSTLTTFAGTNLEEGGELRLTGGTLDTQYVEIIDGTLSGDGLVTTGSGPIPGQVENRSGLVSPGDGLGTLTIEGRFGNGDNGTLLMELGGTTADTEHDLLVVDGQAKLGGTLEVQLSNSITSNYTPMSGDEFTIITATDGVAGAFDTLLLPVIDGLGWLLEYDANAVKLLLTLPGDFNNDGGVTALDLAAWKFRYGKQSEHLDGLDFLNWQRYFGSGGVAASVVPEPSTALLMLIGLACGARGRRKS